MRSNSNNQNKNPLVFMQGITKRFGSVKVLENVDFPIYGGEIHILAGENGAGKSTLMKILSGVYTDYEGTISVDGKATHPTNPLESNNYGISAIYQELSLVPPLSVADNLCLGHPLTKYGFIDKKAEKVEASRTLERIGLDVDVDSLVEDFSLSVQQLIEIAKAIRLNAKVIVMDEPSSALNSHDVETLFSLVDQLKKQNCGIVYITHRMEEIYHLADRISVLRDGRLIGSALACDVPEKKLITWMVGREINEQFPVHETWATGESLRVEHFSVYKDSWYSKAMVDNVSFAVGKGEILGIGGLQGSGASDLFMGIFGSDNFKTQGTIYINTKPVKIHSPREAIRNGIALLTNDRKATGLVLSMSVIANICMASMRKLSIFGFMNERTERKVAQYMVKTLGIKARSLEMDVKDLSGGNQQKVAIGKWLQTKPEIMLLDEPTRGVDVSAKHEIYQQMNTWKAEGLSIVLITSEMPELLALSDRIIVMHRGKITAEFAHDEATAENVLEAAMGKSRISDKLSQEATL